MEYQKAMVLVALDLSASFNTVDLGILLDTFNHRFGVDSSALEWYSFCLQGKSMTVHCNDSKAKHKQLQWSVPQGSCGGQVLYLIYGSMIQDNIPPTIDLHAFADNHGLKNHFKIGDIIEELNAVPDLESCVCVMLTSGWTNIVSKWMHQKGTLLPSVLEISYQELTPLASTSAKI